MTYLKNVQGVSILHSQVFALSERYIPIHVFTAISNNVVGQAYATRPQGDMGNLQVTASESKS